MQQDTIFIQELKTYAYIGVYDWEQKTRQAILLDLFFTTDINTAAASDNLKDTLDYANIAKQIIQLVENSSFALIETLAQTIANFVLNNFKTDKVKIIVYKPNACLQAKTVGVCIERSRSKSSSTE